MPKLWTKLVQWLTFGSLYLSLWYNFLTNYETMDPHITLLIPYDFVLYNPIILIALFGIYSIITIIYRVCTFNDCPEAEKELRRQVEEAKKDLTSKGMKFD